MGSDRNVVVTDCWACGKVVVTASLNYWCPRCGVMNWVLHEH